MRVIIEDIPEDDIPAYITETKLNRDDLKSGQRAALVIRLFYKEGGEQGKRSDLFPIGKKLNTQTALAKKAGVGNGSIGRLTEVYRNRPDLFERVFNGEYSINRAYTQMKNDEAPEVSKYRAFVCVDRPGPVPTPQVKKFWSQFSCALRSELSEYSPGGIIF